MRSTTKYMMVIAVSMLLPFTLYSQVREEPNGSVNNSAMEMQFESRSGTATRSPVIIERSDGNKLSGRQSDKKHVALVGEAHSTKSNEPRIPTNEAGEAVLRRGAGAK